MQRFVTSGLLLRRLFCRMGSVKSKEAQFVDNVIDNNCVVVFSKTTCAFCRMAKDVLSKTGVEYQVVELNKRSDGQQIQEILQNMTGVSTVSMPVSVSDMYLAAFNYWGMAQFVLSVLYRVSS